MSELIKILKSIGLMPIVILAIIGLGTVITSVVPWIWLTYFFVIIRHLLLMINFMFDTGALITVIGLILTIEVAYMVFRAIMFPVAWFHKQQ